MNTALSDRRMATPLVRKVNADWLYHAMAILLVGAVMLHGISVTRDLDWPPGSDFFRDVAAAEAIKQSAGEAIQFKRLLADPNYRDEAFWYSPLTPGIVATLSAITGAPAHIVDARAGAYLNAATPLTFYALMVSMFGAGPALLSLVAFLFLQPYPSWLQATYSPWLVVSNFAQAAFYTTLLVWRRFLRTNTGSAAALTGLSLGVTLLAHTAPAAMLGVIFSVSVISLLIAPPQGLSRARIIGLSGSIVGIALLVSAPVWATVAHYHGQVRNLLPFVWIEPDLGPERIRTWLEGNLARPVLNIGIVAGIGLVWWTRDFRRESKQLLATWLVGAVILFVWAGYSWRVFEPLIRYTIAPAHHFVIYYRATEATLFGCGCWLALSLLLRMMNVRWLVPAITMATALLLVATNVDTYLAREDFGPLVEHARGLFATERPRAVLDWIETRTRPRDVFLAPENAGLSFVSSVGRKVVLVDRFYSNPYLDWGLRNEQQQELWNALANAECEKFNTAANALSVRYVFSILESNPDVRPGVHACGLPRVFESGEYEIFQRY